MIIIYNLLRAVLNIFCHNMRKGLRFVAMDNFLHLRVQRIRPTLNLGWRARFPVPPWLLELCNVLLDNICRISCVLLAFDEHNR